MKKLLLSLITILFIASCSKKDDVDPNLAAQVEGTYQVSDLDGISLPQNGVSVELKLTRKDDVTVNMSSIVYESGKIVNQEGNEVVLSKSGDRILLKEGSDQVGYVEGKTLILDFIDEDGERVKVVSSK